MKVTDAGVPVGEAHPIVQEIMGDRNSGLAPTY